MLPIEPNLLQVNDKDDSFDSIETPTKRRKRGRPTKHGFSMPGLGEPWHVSGTTSSSPGISIIAPSDVPSSDMGINPPSLGMYTSSPTVESPQTVRKSRTLPISIDKNHISSPSKSSPTTLRGLSINDIPSSPIQGYHVSFSKEDDSQSSRLSSRSASPTARKSIKRTFSEQENAVSALFAAPGDRRVNFVIENGRASVTHTTDDNAEGDTADDASSISTHSIAPSQLKAPINDHLHNNPRFFSRQYSYDTSTSNVKKLPSWDASESDTDSEGSAPKYSAYSVYEGDAVPITADAMAAFAQTIARSRARERSKVTTPPLQVSRWKKSGKSTVLQTPAARTVGYPYRYSPFLKEDSTMPKVLASPYAAASAGSAFALAVTATSVSSQDHSASTPPGSMLLVDDVFSAFGSTGMTPYLPSRSG